MYQNADPTHSIRQDSESPLLLVCGIMYLVHIPIAGFLFGTQKREPRSRDYSSTLPCYL